MINAILNRKGGWIAGIAVAIAAFVALNVGLSGLTGVRVDLTQDRLFTLSDGTEKILQRIEEPISMDLYVSQRLVKEVALYGLYATRVRDMINEFAAVSNGKVTVIERDPVPFSETEDSAVSAGVQGVPIDASGERVYFGLVARAGDKTESVPFFQPSREAFLEYDLARMIEGLTKQRKPVIGIVTDLPMFGGFDPRSQEKRWMLIDGIEESFEVRNIFDIEADLNDEIDVLFMAHSTRLKDKQLYVIDQFLMRGGRALLMVDPYSEVAALNTLSGRPIARHSTLNGLLGKWGVSVDETMVVSDMTLARMVNAGTADNVKPAPYLLWPSFKGASINPDDAVTRDITSVNMGTPGAIAVAGDAAVKVETLLETTEKSHLFNKELINPREPNILEFIEKFQADGKKLVTAVRISGEVESAFPDGEPKPEPEPEAAKPDEAKPDGAAPAEAVTPAFPPAGAEPAETEPKRPHIARSQKPLNIVLIADTDMLETHFWATEQEFFGQRVVQPFANNGDLVINALENLAGSGDLITLRSRGTAQRPFTRVEALRIAADEQYRSREQALATRLQETQKKFDEAQQKANAEAQGGAAAPVVTAEQKAALEAELETLRTDLLTIRKELRDVQLKLREDIEALDSKLRFANITLVPFLVGVFAIILGIARIRRRSAANA
ncbi:MAG: Gldg family protein [Proteobacteria bacterium]|nr:Gldg family protein [Pseudomonadota bacterium]